MAINYFPSEEEDARQVIGWIEKAGRQGVTIPGDHYGFPAETGRDPATRVVADWITAT